MAEVDAIEETIELKHRAVEAKRFDGKVAFAVEAELVGIVALVTLFGDVLGRIDIDAVGDLDDFSPLQNVLFGVFDTPSGKGPAVVKRILHGRDILAWLFGL